MKKLYAVWVKDMDGNENHFTAKITEEESRLLIEHIASLRQRELIAESVVVEDNHYTLDEVKEEIKDWLDVDEQEG